MKAADLRFCLAMAKDQSVDVSNADMDILFGFGLPDFKPVHASLKAVARCLRWQCCTFAGGWDEAQFNEDRPFYLRNVELSNLTVDNAKHLLTYIAPQKLKLAA